MAIEDEAVDIGERVQLDLRRGVGVRGVDNARAIHRTLTTYGFAGARCWPIWSMLLPIQEQGTRSYMVVILSKCLSETSYRYRSAALGKGRPAVFYAVAQLNISVHYFVA